MADQGPGVPQQNRQLLAQPLPAMPIPAAGVVEVILDAHVDDVLRVPRIDEDELLVVVPPKCQRPALCSTSPAHERGSHTQDAVQGH